MSQVTSRNRSPRGKRTAFLKSFIKSPAQVASVIPSSRFLVEKVSSKMDLSGPRIIAEFGPGEGVHTRELLRRCHPETKLILFELNKELAEELRREFSDDPRVEILNEDCRNIANIARERGIEGFDYIFSGIPFSLMDKDMKQELMYEIYEALKPNSCFIIYQVTNELKRFGKHFDQLESEWCPLNVPPMFVTVYHKNGVVGKKIRP